MTNSEHGGTRDRVDEHVTTAARAAQLAVAADIPWRIKREWLSTVAWFAALPDPAAKMRQRFATRAFIDTRQGEHEHVVPRRWLRDAVMASPEHAAEILALAVACNVTSTEHVALGKYKDCFGWARYIAAGIEVIDTASGAPADLPAMADEQRAVIERLGLDSLHP